MSTQHSNVADEANCPSSLHDCAQATLDAPPPINAKDDVITRGSTWAAIWHMSWPLVVQMSAIAIASFADVWVAGKLGSDTQAAIGLCGQIWFFMLLVTIALSAGSTAIVSRYWGAGDVKTTIEASRQSILFAILFGTISGALGMFCGKPLLHAVGASPAVEQLGWDYLKVDMFSQLPFTVIWVAHSIFRAMGNARVPMMIWCMMTCLIFTLDFALCIHPFHFGIAGIGAAWLIAATVGMILNIVLLKQSPLGECVNFSKMIGEGLSKEWLMRLLRIGIPACIQDLAWVGGNFVLFLIFAQTKDPTSCQAAWAVGFRLEEIIACMPIYALSTAVANIVGQNLGAKQPDRAEKAGWQVAQVGACYSAVLGIVLFVFGGSIAAAMSSDPKVILPTTQYLQITGVTQPLVALWLILFGAMSGAGYTKWPMWVTSTCLTLLRLPLAWALTVPFGFGPAGCWMGIAFSSCVIGTLAVWRFKTGVWKYQKI